MFTVYQLTDALTASLFGMFALWAAASHRHWFVRTAVVGAALLVMLMIPAYEPLVEFSLEVAIVVCGVAVWRRRRMPTPTSANRQGPLLRLSLETMLLFMAVVAVVTAVAARAPHLTMFEWYGYVYVGAAAALMVLISIWVVCGRTRWWVRLLAVPALIYWFALVMRWLVISRWMLQYWFTTPSSIKQYWNNILGEGIFSGTSYWLGSIGLGTTILCLWLLVAQRAGWFDPFRDALQSAQGSGRVDGQQFVARCVACMLFVLVSSYSLWLLYLLMTPMQIPDLAGRRPSGYDELLRAGRLIGETDEHGGLPLWRMSKAQLREVVSTNSTALAVTHAALKQDCRFPLVRPWNSASVPQGDDRRALYGLQNMLWAREFLAAKDDAIDDEVAAELELLQLAFTEDRSNGVDLYQRYAVFVTGEYGIVNNVWFRRTKLDSRQCTELAHRLRELESGRVAWQTKLLHERIIAENSGFEPHLRAILDGWAGIDQFDGSRWTYFQSRTRMRLLIVALALRAYELDNNRLPPTLAELSPKYLPTIPDDPFDPSQPLHYRRPHAGYMLYSVGPNKVDDSQEADANAVTRTSDDLSEAIEFPPANAPDQTNADEQTKADESQ